MTRRYEETILLAAAIIAKPPFARVVSDLLELVAEHDQLMTTKAHSSAADRTVMIITAAMQAKETTTIDHDAVADTLTNHHAALRLANAESVESQCLKKLWKP